MSYIHRYLGGKEGRKSLFYSKNKFYSIHNKKQFIPIVSSLPTANKNQHLLWALGFLCWFSVWLSFMYEQTRAEALPLTAALCSSERHTASFCLPRREISKCSGTPEFFIGLTFSFTPLHLHICIEDWEITLRLWFALTLHISWGYLGLWRRVSNMENGLFFLTYLY